MWPDFLIRKTRANRKMCQTNIELLSTDVLVHELLDRAALAVIIVQIPSNPTEDDLTIGTVGDDDEIEELIDLVGPSDEEAVL